jgi:hypothetical protein
MDTMTEKEPKPPYPYTSFRTILNLAQRFEGEKGPPTRLDRGVLNGSEGSKTQVIAALKFLGLIGPKGEALPPLTDLSLKANERPQLVADLLKRHYAKQVQLGQTTATQQELEETFGALDGTTKRKAVAFFLHAAEFAKLPLSPYFKTPRVGTAIAAVGRRRKRNSDSAGTAPPAPSNGSGAPDLRQRYLDLLMKKVESGDQLDEKLLDRIETLLGYRKAESE